MTFFLIASFPTPAAIYIISIIMIIIVKHNYNITGIIYHTYLSHALTITVGRVHNVV